MNKKIISILCSLTLGVTSIPMLTSANSLEVKAETTVSDSVEINVTNFPDTMFRTNITKLDTNSDGFLSTDEIASVTEINVCNVGAYDLTGIEYFTSLESLNCAYNHLTSLDVSKNSALKSLDCDNNKLTSLDVSNNSALKTLYCYRNQLASLDVSKNPDLQTLYCFYNQLTSLDVSNNSVLQDLNCSYNQLTSLDVSNNTALVSLYCFVNEYDIGVVSSNVIDLNDYLPEDFNVEKASNWVGATYNSNTGKLIIVKDNTGTITYDYDMGYHEN